MRLGITPKMEKRSVERTLHLDVGSQVPTLYGTMPRKEHSLCITENIGYREPFVRTLAVGEMDTLDALVQNTLVKYGVSVQFETTPTRDELAIYRFTVSTSMG